MNNAGKTIYSGNDEVFLGTGERALQIIVSLNTPDPNVRRPALCNYSQRATMIVREIGNYWWEEKGLRNGDALRVSLAVRLKIKRSKDDLRKIKVREEPAPFYLGGKGDNFRLVFPSMFEDYAEEAKRSGIDIGRVVASFDGELYEQNDRGIKVLRVNGWEVRTIACQKGNPKDPGLPILGNEDMKAVEMVRDADTTAYYMKKEFCKKPLNELLEDPRLTNIWVGNRKLSVEDVVSSNHLKHNNVTAKQLVQMARERVAA